MYVYQIFFWCVKVCYAVKRALKYVTKDLTNDAKSFSVSEIIVDILPMHRYPIRFESIKWKHNILHLSYKHMVIYTIKHKSIENRFLLRKDVSKNTRNTHQDLSTGALMRISWKLLSCLDQWKHALFHGNFHTQNTKWSDSWHLVGPCQSSERLGHITSPNRLNRLRHGSCRAYKFAYCHLWFLWWLPATDTLHTWCVFATLTDTYNRQSDVLCSR